MGSSDRPKNISATASVDEIIEYFTDHFEKWRIGIGNITNFFLAGHSYGGYLVGHYATKYPQHIRKLLLCSPLGIGYFTEEEINQYDSLEHLGQNGQQPSKFMRDIFNYALTLKTPP